MTCKEVFMFIIIVILVSIGATGVVVQCNKKTIQSPCYINQITIDDTLSYVLIGFKYWEHTQTVNLKPEYGIIVLSNKHDSIAEGYMIVNSVPYHVDSCVSVVVFKHNRSIGYAYGRMVRSTCPPSGNYYFELKYNLYYDEK